MAGEFDPPLDPLIGPALTDLGARLRALTGLAPAERNAVLAGAALSVEEEVRRKITRLLVLEVNAARLSGRLTAADPAARWREWQRSMARPASWNDLAVLYPDMMPRLTTIIRNRCAAAFRLAERFAEDRAMLVSLCGDAEELGAFYRGMGHWLALMRLLGGNDLHAENLIAAGPHPVVVDCESLFAPHAKARTSGYGQAFDMAVELVNGSVMGTGLLPGRGVALGWRPTIPARSRCSAGTGT